MAKKRAFLTQGACRLKKKILVKSIYIYINICFIDNITMFRFYFFFFFYLEIIDDSLIDYFQYISFYLNSVSLKDFLDCI